MATRVASLSGLGVRDRAAPRAGLAVVAAVCLALGLLSLVGPSSPTYDPWAWVIWGREVLHLNLDTRFGPSWKPLPVVVTTVFALVPGAAPALWVAVARAGGLAAIAFAFRVARAIGGGVAGGLLAAGCLLVSTDFVRFAAVGDSEGLLVALLLAALELHLAGRRRAALWAGFGAALLRPESWPFVGLYALWLAWREPPLRRLVAGMTIAGAALWFGPELWGSGNALRAGERARDPNPNALAFAQHPALEVVKRFSSMTPLLAQAGAVLALAQAAVRRRLDAPAALALTCVAWIGVVAVMTESGFSGNARYLIAPTALACVAGGATIGRALGRLAPRAVVATAIAVVALAGVVAFRANDVNTDLTNVRSEAQLNGDLSNAIDRVGGPGPVKRCGPITTGAFQVTLLAWDLRVPIERIKYLPRASGTIFRLPGTPPPPAEHAFHQVARTKLWQVLSTCPLNGRH